MNCRLSSGFLCHTAIGRFLYGNRPSETDPSHAEPVICQARLYFILATPHQQGSHASSLPGHIQGIFESISKRPQRFLLAANKSKAMGLFS